MYNEITFKKATGRDLGTRVAYRYLRSMRNNPEAEGTLVKITLPEFTGKRTFSAQNRMPPATVDGKELTQSGFLLDESGEELARITWGYGGRLSYDFEGEFDSGREFYFLHQIKDVEDRAPNWASDMVFYWMKPRRPRVVVRTRRSPFSWLRRR